MKINVRIFILFFILINANFITSQNRIKLELLLEKNQYMEGEPIVCEAVITNISSSELQVIEPANQIGCQYKLFNENGEEIKYGGPYYSGIWPKYNLKPGEKRSFFANINELFGNKSLEILGTIYDLGYYKLHGYYWSGTDDTASTEISFNIISPEGDEMNAFSDLKNIIESFHTQRSMDLFYAKQKEFVERYPNSLYTPIVLMNMSIDLKRSLNQKEKALEITKQLIENYPDYVAFRPGLLDSKYVRSLSDIEKKNFIQKVYNKAKKKFTHTVIERYAKNIILILKYSNNISQNYDSAAFEDFINLIH